MYFGMVVRRKREREGIESERGNVSMDWIFLGALFFVIFHAVICLRISYIYLNCQHRFCFFFFSDFDVKIEYKNNKISAQVWVNAKFEIWYLPL